MPVAEVDEVGGPEEEGLDGFPEAGELAKDCGADYRGCGGGRHHEGRRLLEDLGEVAEDVGEACVFHLVL